ncbi:uncharacterized protein [Macrobrachium rosenbergii]
MTASSGSSTGDTREERLFAYQTTTSVTKLTTVTVTGLSTCLSTATGSCLGRKKRMAVPSALNLEVLLKDSEADLAGSQTDSFEAAQPFARQYRRRDEEEREGTDGLENGLYYHHPHQHLHLAIHNRHSFGLVSGVWNLTDMLLLARSNRSPSMYT